MICLSTQNGTVPPRTLTGKIREISEQITGYVAGTHHNLTSGNNTNSVLLTPMKRSFTSKTLAEPEFRQT